MSAARVGLVALVLLGFLIAVLAFAPFVDRSALVGALPAGPRDFVRGHWHGFRVERNVMVRMPDGVRLATNLYFPRSAPAPYGTVFMRLPYDKDYFGEAVGPAEMFARHGFAVAVQDVRGKFASEGVFTPSKGEAEDGAATMDWIAQQPWSNGRIGTYGCSSLGEAQLFMGRMRNAHHRAMIAQGAGGAIGTAGERYTYFGLYEGGIFNLGSGFGWFVMHGAKTPGQEHRPAVNISRAVRDLPSIELVRRHRSDPTDYEAFLSTPLADPWWRSLGYIADEDRFAAPALMINSWHDQTVADTLVLSDLLSRHATTEEARNHQHAIVGPGSHCAYEYEALDGRVGDLRLGSAARQPYWDWYLQWFNHWLRDESAPLPDLPRYLLYVIGEDRWLQANEWPPSGVEYRSWHLDASAAANSVRGGGLLTADDVVPNEGFDEFVYDPANPVPTRGGPLCCTEDPAARVGPVDQAEVESRPDVLVYTSAPLLEGLRIVGPLRADLYVSSSARDTDFTAKLVDVWPDGHALNIQEGALRMRYREGYARPVLLAPGEVYKASIDMRAIAYYLPAGHRVRLQISSSNFPRLERNLNTGGHNFDEKQPVVARNRVYHGGGRLSALVLPVLKVAL